MPRLLVVEDDLRIRNALIRSLGARGFEVRSTATGRKGLEVALKTLPELVVLDLGLPDIDGSRLLRMLRAASAVPVIVVTARDDEEAVVDLLEHGADDYIIKPFSAETLSARITAVLRRYDSGDGNHGGGANGRLVVGNLVVDLLAHTVALSGRTLELRPREFDLLALLAARPGQVVSRRTIMAEVWQSPYGGADKTVDVHLSWLRRKLGETATSPVFLHTVRNVGVKLVDPCAS